MPAMKKSLRANWKSTRRGAMSPARLIGSSGANARRYSCRSPAMTQKGRNQSAQRGVAAMTTQALRRGSSAASNVPYCRRSRGRPARFGWLPRPAWPRGGRRPPSDYRAHSGCGPHQPRRPSGQTPTESGPGGESRRPQLACQLGCLIHELLSVAVGRIPVKPVEEQQTWASAATIGFDEVGRRIGDLDVVDRDAVAAPAGVASACLRLRYRRDRHDVGAHAVDRAAFERGRRAASAQDSAPVRQ